MDVLPIKCVVVGDGAIGKTALVKTYLDNKFYSEDIPTSVNCYETSVTLDGRVHPFTIWDCSGVQDFSRLRQLTYPETNVFVLCYPIYSIDKRWRFLNIRNMWIPEIRDHCKDVPIVLVATKTDLRQEQAENTLISSEEGRHFAESIGAACYLECSAKQLTGVREVFETAATAARAYLYPTTGKVKKCNLM